jgi:hypothetical protein
MALADTIYQATSFQDMQTQLNAYLASLTNPTIRSWSVQAADLVRQIGVQYRAQLTTETGGTALATPFQVDILQADNVAALQTLMAAYRVTYAGQFISQPKFWYEADDNVTSSKVIAAFMRNTTLGAGAANYLILQ